MSERGQADSLGLPPWALKDRLTASRGGNFGAFRSCTSKGSSYHSSWRKAAVPALIGAKGMGEGGILAAAPALCNAVYDATGVRFSAVALRGQRIWSAIEAANKSS